MFVTPEPSSLAHESDLPFSFYSSHSCRRPWSQFNHRGAPHTLDGSADSIMDNIELSPLFLLYRTKVKRACPTHLPQEQTLTGWAPRTLVWTPGGPQGAPPQGPHRPGQRETSSPAGSPSPALSVEAGSGNRGRGK